MSYILKSSTVSWFTQFSNCFVIRLLENSLELIYLIEGVEKRYLRYITFKILHFNTNTADNSIESIKINLRLRSLSCRRTLTDNFIIYKLINGRTSCSSFLELIHFHIKISTNSIKKREKNNTTNSIKFQPMSNFS